jgi:curved DNA-binding protein
MAAGETILTIETAHAILGLARGADPGETKKAFHAAAKLAHPDRPGGSAQRFREVVSAYRLLQSRPLPALIVAQSPVGLAEILALTAIMGGETWVTLSEGRRLKVRIPAGARHGERLKVGAADNLTIRILPDEAIQVRGSDVWITAPAPALILEAGGRLSVDTALGTKVLWVSRAAAERRLVRLPGEGLPARAPFAGGSLFVRLAARPHEESSARALLRRFAAAWAA